jgi:membrane protein implicated in regulation of membrane protease activity
MLIFAAIAAFGVLVLLGMLFLGDVFGGDHDIGHGGDIGGDHGGPSILSARIMASFLTAFGVGGALARYYGISQVASTGVGIVAGVAMSGVVYQFAKLLYSQQASSELHMQDLIGVSAEVSVAIPEGGVGQVVLSAGGQRSEHIARASDGRAIPRGTRVVVTALGGDWVVVAPAATGGSR